MYNPKSVLLSCLISLSVTAGSASASTNFLQSFAEVNCGGGVDCNVDMHYDSPLGGRTVITNPGLASGTITPNGPNASGITMRLNGVNGSGGSTSAVNRMDLTTASIHGSVSSNTGGGGIIDTMRDNITFTNANGGAVPITVHWLMDGTMTANQGGAFDAFGNLYFGGGFQYTGHLDYNGNVVNNYSIGNGWTSTSITAVPNQFGYAYTGTYLLDPGQTQLPFMLQFTLGGGLGSADFTNTSAVWLDLPSGVSFTSESGEFLTGAASPVPEPAEVMTTGIALALLTVGAWRKRLRTISN